ncbi:MAG: hypothetical protein U9N45_06390 [Gemmatimonadota bacterium]|nr:hypothetical protein [Gemmatimonadota bacterium]
MPPGKRRKDNLDIFTRRKYGKLRGEPEIRIKENKPEKHHDGTALAFIV